MGAPEPHGVSLLERALAGDKEAFGEIAEEHRGALLRLCEKMTGSRDEAEDLVQETLLKAYAKFGTFELRSSVGTWLYRIATNACLDHQRARKPWDLDKRWQWFEENAEAARNVEQSLYLTPERAVEVREVAATCINCITMSDSGLDRTRVTKRAICGWASASVRRRIRRVGGAGFPPRAVKLVGK